MSSLAIFHASQLVTVAGPNRPRVGAEMQELAIIQDGGMLIRDGRIAAVGKSDVIKRDSSGDVETVDASGKVVMPGFVDAHTHLVFAGNRLDDFERRARCET
jgi:imidazolonepropionase